MSDPVPCPCATRHTRAADESAPNRPTSTKNSHGAAMLYDAFVVSLGVTFGTDQPTSYVS
eukprot:1493597-Prymnesium_polylepis.1